MSLEIQRFANLTTVAVGRRYRVAVSLPPPSRGKVPLTGVPSLLETQRHLFDHHAGMSRSGGLDGTVDCSGDLMQWLERNIRLLKFLVLQRVKTFDVPEDPHFDAASTDYFVDRLGLARSYLEYGSGGSTRLAARLGVSGLSIESDRYYAKSVSATLPTNASISLMHVDIGMTGFWGMPIRRKPTASRRLKWRKYVEAPFAMGRLTDCPDFVLVDGRFRRACALRIALEAQRRGCDVTIMIDDYASTGRSYELVEALLGTPEMKGRSAIFEVGPSTRVEESDVDEAITDIR